ncbi:MAG: response regulator, partial [Polyangiaceae bacterium]
LGLGLAIVHHLVHLHGGSVQVWSDGPGKGATFAVTLPVRRSSERLRAVTTPPADVAPQTLAGVEILVVDDEPDARDLLSAVLAKCGAIVTVASSAHEAIEHVRRRMPDALVSDIGMPGEDGYSLMKKVAAHASRHGKARPPSVAVTAFATTDDRERALRAGFHSHLAKPVDPAELVFTIAALVDPSLRAVSSRA